MCTVLSIQIEYFSKYSFILITQKNNSQLHHSLTLTLQLNRIPS